MVHLIVIPSLSGAILSTANDMARWMNMILNDGAVNGTRVLDSDVLAEVTTPVNAHVYNPALEYTTKPRYSYIQNHC